MTKRYIPTRLTPDPELNREAMDPEVKAMADILQEKMGARMVQYAVVQGSEAAEKAARAERLYAEKQAQAAREGA